METVTSKDGTMIAFDRLGQGPPVVLVSGGSVDRTSNAPLAQALAPHFTVLNYDRRGRGPSGDTQPYAIEREIEDIEAVIGAAGGDAGLYGSSSGAVLAMLAAEAGLAIAKLAMWEPPFVPEGVPRPPEDQVEQYETMVGEGRPGDAVEYFMAKVVGLPPAVRRRGSEPALVEGHRGARPHPRLRREDHGRLPHPGGARGHGDRSNARRRRRGGHAVDARHGEGAGGRAPQWGGAVPRGPGPQRRSIGARPRARRILLRLTAVARR